jgi:hypothetical protein
MKLMVFSNYQERKQRESCMDFPLLGPGRKPPHSPWAIMRYMALSTEKGWEMQGAVRTSGGHDYLHQVVLKGFHISELKNLF